jgi:hypothetical protein
MDPVIDANERDLAAQKLVREFFSTASAARERSID